MWLFVTLVIIGHVVGEQNLLEEQHYQLPQYTQLDEYGECLSGNNGLYCFGSFRIHPNHNGNETYRLIKEYSDQKFRYDRTLFHRGYCVSARCPPHPNPNTRFEKCVQQWASKNHLNTTLEKLHYCKTSKTPAVLHSSAQAFMWTIFFIFLFNFLGTLIDLTTKDGTNSRFCSAWSVRSNWKQFVEPFGGDPDRTALAPIQVMRVVLLTLIIIIHVACIAADSYMGSPLWFEKYMLTPLRIFYAKGISAVQVFYVMSSFLTSYNLLLLTKRQNIGLWMLPKQFLKRYFRIAPLHLLTIWFAATWWPYISDGPMWSKIETENAICRRKFWTHVLHINNIVEGDQFCLVQTWSLAADIQFQLVSLILTLAMAQYELPKIKILVGLLISACVLNGSLSYLFNWKPMLQMANEINMADSFHVEYTFLQYYYMSPWGSLPSCLVGLIMGHVTFQIRLEGFHNYKDKWLQFMCRYSLLFLLLWVSAGWWTCEWENPGVMAFFLAIERPMFCIPPTLWLFGLINDARRMAVVKNLSRQIWIPLGRLSLSVLMLHWVIIETRLSSQSYPVVITTTALITEFVVAWCLSYLLAVPLTLLVEMPLINTYDYISKLDFELRLQCKQVTNKTLRYKQE